MSLLVTFVACSMVIVDSERRNELRTRWIGTVDTILGSPFKGSFTETAKLLVIQNPHSNSGWHNIAAATRGIQLFVFDRAEEHLPGAIKTKFVTALTDEQDNGASLKAGDTNSLASWCSVG